MESSEMTTMELIEAVEHDAYAELRRREYGDPERGKILGEAETCFKIRNGYEQTEQNRLNNYTKNEIEDRKVDVEMKKAKNDGRRIVVEVFKFIGFTVVGVLSGFAGYALDTWYQQDKRLSKFQDKCHDLSMRK